MSQKQHSSGGVFAALTREERMKYEIARELGVDYQQAYKGNLSARENGYVGGYMVKRLIEKAEKSMAGK